MIRQPAFGSVRDSKNFTCRAMKHLVFVSVVEAEGCACIAKRTLLFVIF